MITNDTTQKELAAERQSHLHRIIRDRRAVRVDELCAELGVSPATVRRDLEALEDRGGIRRVHGGAVSIESRLEEPQFDDKTAIAAREKRAIAEAALKLIEPDDTVYLDGGSTVLELARLLRDRTDITAVTNSLRAAIELGASGPRLILIGGELRRRSQTMVGPLSRCLLESIHVDKAFMGTIGVSPDGLTTTDPAEAFTKERVMRQAVAVVLLADHTKIGKVSFAKSGDLDDIHILITDERADPLFLKSVRKKNVKVIKTRKG